MSVSGLDVPQSSRSPELRELVLATASKTVACLVPLVMILSGLLLVRVTSRAEAPPVTMSAASSWLAGFVWIGMSLLMHLAIQRFLLHAEWGAVWAWALRLCPAITLLAGVLTLTLAMRSWTASGLWVVAGAVVFAVVYRDRSRPQRADAMDDADDVIDLDESLPDGEGSSAPSTNLWSDTSDDLGGSVTCRVEQREIDGGETVVTMWRQFTMAPWQSRQTLHFPFWPPLHKTPIVAGEANANGGAVLNVQQVERHGCRVEVQLDEADEREQIVQVELMASPPDDPTAD